MNVSSTRRFEGLRARLLAGAALGALTVPARRVLLASNSIAALGLALAFPTSAVALCTNNPPGSGMTAVCSGINSTQVIATPGSTNVTINVLSGASVSASRGSGSPFPLLSVEQNSIITNNGALSLTGGGGSGTNRGAAMLGNGNSDQLTNTAGATINTTGTYNDGMAATGGGNTLTNYGTITTTGPNAYGMTAVWIQNNPSPQPNNTLIKVLSRDWLELRVA